MSQTPTMIFTTSQDGARVVEVADTEFPGIADLVAAHPAIAQDAVAQAEAVTYFAVGDDLSVIADPTAFKTNYLAQLDKEDPSAPFDQSVVRLSDFGAPDFAEIKTPGLEAGKLVWFCRDGYTGLPYRASVDMSDPTAPEFTPLVLAPVAAR